MISRKPIHAARRRAGLTLLELAVVTVIIGVLASMAVPSFRRALEQSRVDVASANLRAIWSAQRLYWLDNRAYAASIETLQSLDLLDGSIANQSLFAYEISASNSTGFTALATRVSNGGWNGTLGIDGTGAVTGALSAMGESDIVPNY